MSTESDTVNGPSPMPHRPTILFLTGTRADFGKMKPLIKAVAGAEDFEYALFVTGMHMLSRYGSTVNEVRKAGFENIFTHINQDARESGMDLILANTIGGLGLYIREFPPDLIVVHGDRVEALAGAAVGALHNVLVAHIEGGEVSGTVDELLRHATSKLCHLHFVSNERARQRLVQMGELDESIFVIGSPGIDIMLSDTLPAIDEVKERYGVPFDEYGIFVYHPVTTELDRTAANIEAVLSAAEDAEMNFVVIYPNNDSGSHVIMDAIQRLRDNPRFHLLPSMRFEYYLTLLRHARLILGNSSSGVHEAPVYGVPTLNVGTRQANRFQSESITNLPEDRAAILNALGTIPRSFPPTHFFGRGTSADQFLRWLRDSRFWSTSRQKQFRDIDVPTPAAD